MDQNKVDKVKANTSSPYQWSHIQTHHKTMPTWWLYAHNPRMT
jgi:hypothetical protein